ncbi:putative nucleotidyltransferase [Oceanisphaera litoralis]|uniref:nucleotidyltransferase domain-containing protein n=1 Tax=Oceanisphaera litoralis TaxID=225144 RepID=UPI00195B17B7|nr:nucleotidyltransferase domain-containing protein [Oceanisphaera litoralis]MBM7455268.1 putative nucleotidyltransferase [Oceanisphaera litoralis]
MQINDYVFLQQLAGLPFVQAIWLFGSRARGDHRERSDIDLAISCPNASEADWLQLLEIVAQADTLLGIDCIWLEREPEQSALRAAIERDKEVLYERQPK